MTIGQVIRKTEAAAAGTCSNEEIICWLSRVDGTVKRQILDTHEGGAVIFTEYTADTPMDTQLLVPEPFAALYEHYVTAQIAYKNLQQEEHNCAIDLFNQVWKEFRNDYNRTHMPKRVRFTY